MGSRDDRVKLSATVDFGQAELLPDPRNLTGWRLLVDGVDQSYVDLGDPLRLDMMYARLLCSVVDAAGVPGGRLRALHLGAGGLTVARYAAAARPGSTQLAVEVDRRLLDFVRFGLPLPADASLTVRVGDARDVLESLDAGGYDLVITDTYHGGQMPRRLAGVEYAAQAARVLAPGGVYAVNVLDMPGLTLSKRQAATLREVFADVCLLATPGMLRGRRDGNVVLAATREAGGVPVGRIQKAARARLNLAMRHGRALDRLLSGTAPVTG